MRTSVSMCFTIKAFLHIYKYFMIIEYVLEFFHSSGILDRMMWDLKQNKCTIIVSARVLYTYLYIYLVSAGYFESLSMYGRGECVLISIWIVRKVCWLALKHILLAVLNEKAFQCMTVVVLYLDSCSKLKSFQ